MRYIWFCLIPLLAACNINPASITLVTPTAQIMATNAMTPTAMFSNELGMGGFPAITLETIGVIPANTRVNVSTATLQDEWVYSIYDANGNYEEARESQLAFAPGITPGAPTPTAGFDRLWQQGTVYAMTLADVGNIPAGTRVQVGGGYYGNGEWVYMVGNSELGLSGEIPESQLEVIEVEPYDYSTAIPTPTTAFSSLWQQGTVYALTLAHAGDIPAGTRVQVSTGYYANGEWVYMVSNIELGLSGEIAESQLEVIEVEPFNYSTAVPTQTP